MRSPDAGLRPAGGAQPEYRQVPDIRREPLGFLKRRYQRPDGCLVHFRYPLALPADEVHMLRFRGQVIAGGPVLQMRVADQPELLEQLKRAVHGGDVDPARRQPYVSEDLFRRRMLKPETASSISWRCGVTRYPLARNVASHSCVMS